MIEVNARMASGIALTFAAGGAYPEWLLRMLEGRAGPAVMGEYRSGLYVATSPAAVVSLEARLAVRRSALSLTSPCAS